MLGEISQLAEEPAVRAKLYAGSDRIRKILHVAHYSGYTKSLPVPLFYPIN